MFKYPILRDEGNAHVPREVISRHTNHTRTPKLATKLHRRQLAGCTTLLLPKSPQVRLSKYLSRNFPKLLSVGHVHGPTNQTVDSWARTRSESLFRPRVFICRRKGDGGREIVAMKNVELPVNARELKKYNLVL